MGDALTEVASLQMPASACRQPSRYRQLLAYGRLCELLNQHVQDVCVRQKILAAAREYAAAEHELGTALSSSLQPGKALHR
ncbi:MAG: hypothetical protein KGJ55_06990 [Gammaproteobacteria bacterium]|nr:hypothetical protein [Gammaproteobacteria bacterium]